MFKTGLKTCGTTEIWLFLSMSNNVIWAPLTIKKSKSLYNAKLEIIFLLKHYQFDTYPMHYLKKANDIKVDSYLLWL